MVKNLFVLICGALLLFACDSNYDAIYDTEWKLSSIKSASGEELALPADKVPNLKLQKDGGVFGFAGCNQFRGTATTEKGAIKFNGVAMTRMMCIDNTVENAYTEMLNTADNFKIKGDKLIIRNGDKILAEFAK